MEANRTPHDPEEESPVVIVEFEAEDLILTWANTKLRFYKNNAYDHVEVEDDDGDTIGIIPKQSFMDLLFEKNYPADYRPVVEPETIEWFVRMSTDDLETLTPEAFNG